MLTVPFHRQPALYRLPLISTKNPEPPFLWFSEKLKSTYNVGNKEKGRISKRVFQENKARQIFRKMNISYPLIRKTLHLRSLTGFWICLWKMRFTNAQNIFNSWSLSRMLINKIIHAVKDMFRIDTTRNKFLNGFSVNLSFSLYPQRW